MVPPT
jgi:hypothetical protein